MAINKVIYGNDTLIDISDTTAEANDVASGKYFYDKSGVRTLGTGSSGGFPEFTIKGNVVLTVDKGSVTSSDIQYALTSDREIGMIWGEALIKGAGPGATNMVTCTTNVQVAPQTQTRTIKGVVSLLISTSTTQTIPYYEIDTSGNLTIKYTLTTNNTQFIIPPVIIRFSDF